MTWGCHSIRASSAARVQTSMSGRRVAAPKRFVDDAWVRDDDDEEDDEGSLDSEEGDLSWKRSRPGQVTKRRRTGWVPTRADGTKIIDREQSTAADDVQPEEEPTSSVDPSFVSPASTAGCGMLSRRHSRDLPDILSSRPTTARQNHPPISRYAPGYAPSLALHLTTCAPPLSPPSPPPQDQPSWQRAK